MTARMPGSAWTGYRGDLPALFEFSLGGVPVVDSPAVDDGVAVVFERDGLRYYMPNVRLRHSSGDPVKDYIRDRANELRSDLGLEQVDYHAEDMRRITDGLLHLRAEIRAFGATVSNAASTLGRLFRTGGVS